MAGSKRIAHGLTIVLCLLLFVNSENIYFKRSDMFSAIFELLFISVCFMYIYVTKLYKLVNMKQCVQVIIIATTYIIAILCIYLFNIEKSSINNMIQKLAILGVLLPLMIVIFNGFGYSNALRLVVRTYINIAAAVSFFGLILWLLFNLGVHLPTIQVPYQWGGPRVGSGILGLTFDVQYSDIAFAAGWSRYSLFYVEGGIAAAYFGLAGILESTCNPTPRLPIVFMFAVCTFCTLSGFGMIFAPIVLYVGLFSSGYLKRVGQRNVACYGFINIIIVAIIIATPMVILSLFSQKTNVESIASHANDFTYGTGVFLDRPLLGYGIGNYAPLYNAVDGLSGTSSSLMLGLIQGGIVYVVAILIPFCIAIVLAFTGRQYRSAVLFSTPLLLYINGMSDNSPMFICMMALAYAYIYSRVATSCPVHRTAIV